MLSVSAVELNSQVRILNEPVRMNDSETDVAAIIIRTVRVFFHILKMNDRSINPKKKAMMGPLETLKKIHAHNMAMNK